MCKPTSLLATALALLAPASLSAQGDIGTISRGSYICELPGNALAGGGTEVGVAQPQASFTIDSASRYTSPQGSGTYLRRGETVTFTSGPRNGEAYAIVGRDFLRKIETDGQPGRLRCLRRAG